MSKPEESFGCLIAPVVLAFLIIAFYILERLLKLINDIAVFDIIIPFLICFAAGIAVWYIAHKKSVKTKLASLFLFLIFIIFSFGIAYRQFYLTEPTSFKINSDYEGVYETKLLQKNIKQKYENYKLMVVLDLMKTQKTKLRKLLRKSTTLFSSQVSHLNVSTIQIAFFYIVMNRRTRLKMPRLP